MIQLALRIELVLSESSFFTMQFKRVAYLRIAFKPIALQGRFHTLATPIFLYADKYIIIILCLIPNTILVFFTCS